MHLDYHLLIPPFFGLTMAFVIYRRFKKSIGFQKLNPFWMKFRMSALALIGCVLLYGAVLKPTLFIFILGGLTLGLILVILAVRHSEIENREEVLYFRTHILIETTVILLLIGRVGYRFYTIVKANSLEAMVDPRQNLHFLLDPWTAGIFFILVTYYVGYFFIILDKSKNLLSPNK